MKTINTVTGEISDKGNSPSYLGRKLPNTIATRKIGVSVPYPYFCRSAEDLQECLSIIDPYWKKKDKPKVKDWAILQAMREGYLSQYEVLALSSLCENVIGWNIIYGNKTNLRPDNINKVAWFKALKTLEEKNYIHHLYQKGYEQIWLIHPFYCWKGDIVRVQSYLDQWTRFMQGNIPSPVQQ